jgi:glyoxylase-like metal-dependent hydrolase (beta-lactamase superfamily II)
VSDLPATGGWRPVLIESGRLPMEARQLAPGGELGDGVVEVPSNVLLLRGPEQTVLIDAGSGSLAEEWPGGQADLAGALERAGSVVDDVDLVVVTHLDFDHFGGALDLPRARVAIPADAEPSSPSGEETLKRLEAAGRVDRVEDGGTPAPGLTVRAAPGHRSGHSIIEVGGDVVHLADVVHHIEHVPNPDWDRVFDSDVQLALATRTAVLDEMVRRGVIVTASHIAGAGRIEPGGDGALRWQPV